MVEAFAVASGKGGTGKTTSTLALGMALAEEHDVTVVDADTGMANLLFHAGLDDATVTLHDLLVEGTATAVSEATYDRFGLSVVPCGTSLAGFEAAEPGRLREVVAELASDTDVLLLDSPAALGSKSAVLPVVLADRVVVVVEPTIPALSDGLKVQEYARSYGTETAGVLFNKVRDDAADVAEQAEQRFGGPVLANVPDSDAVRAARRAGSPSSHTLPRASRPPATGGPRPGSMCATATRGRRRPLPERGRPRHAMTGTTGSPELRIPRGDLLRSRVVSDVGTTLARALDRELTGYATLVPQETLLLEGDARGVVTFADGVPVLAYNTVSDSGGPDALAELAVPGPYRVELYAVEDGTLETAHEEDALRVAPGAAATELADDQALADRTRDAAPRNDWTPVATMTATRSRRSSKTTNG